MFAKDTIEILNQECIGGIYFPSAFTPNGDGKNDSFKPIIHARLTNYYFAIYNRLGHVVFEEIESAKG